MKLSLICAVIVVVLMPVLMPHASASYEQEVMADNPFVYYRFDETEGTVAKDSSGRGHDGSYVDVELGQASAAAALGTAIRLNGASSLVDVPALGFESDQFTIETWLNVDYILGACCTSVFSPEGWNTGWVHYNLGEPGRIEFALNGGGPNDRWTDADALPLEEWAHVVSVYNFDEEIHTYVNGEEVDMTPPGFDSPQTVTLTAEAQIGAWQNSRFLAGAMDEFAIYDTALTPQRVLAHFNARNASVAGDFDGDALLSEADINLLSDEVRKGTNTASFNLDADPAVNGADRDVWVNTLKKTYYGDSNLDGQFNSSDFVAVFSKGEYEDLTATNSTWGDGDWNGDGDFDSSDFVTAFQAGGYEQGPRAAVMTVPEPSSTGMIVFSLLPLARRVRRRLHCKSWGPDCAWS